MISEFKIHKSSMLYDNKTGVIFEKPYNEFAQAHLNSHNNKYLQALIIISICRLYRTYFQKVL